MFETIGYLERGNKKQHLAYEAINSLRIIRNLSEYNPILCGTLPIGIDMEDSDLDIIMKVFDPNKFEKKVKSLYGDKEKFLFKKSVIRNINVSKANFFFQGFEFELFGQPQYVKKQHAYLHMVIEDFLMTNHPSIKEKVILLKRKGYKTEPAFCEVLGLEGDPYEALINFGKNNKII
ncbi:MULTISPECIES: DUF4269 domain-containing protein [Paraliobacillus]|uniref:DUF4269 domain-containing protein n=1 Tax=Paraliobacillus TaxID=200903 RepID=UPI000DD3A5DC|nr:MULTISPECIES: DUF4269 domain-containing protein [Paraliobacillus]